jgi:hypothetical protein
MYLLAGTKLQILTPEEHTVAQRLSQKRSQKLKNESTILKNTSKY